MSETIESGTQPEADVAIAADTPTTSETAEETTAETTDPAANLPKPDEPKRRPWFEKVIADKAHEAREYKRQAEAYQAQLQSLQQRPAQQPQQGQPQQPLISEADFERRVDQRAAEREFTNSCNETHTAGLAKFADFNDAVNTFTMLGGPPIALLEAITSLGKDDGAKVFYDLGKDPDEAARIMALPPVKMAMALAKMATAAPKTIAVSKVPDPIKPVQGANTRSDAEPDPKNFDAWSKWYRTNSNRR